MTLRTTAGRAAVLALMSVALLSAPAAAGPPDVPDPDGPRVPVALAWGRDGLLRVALRDAGQVVAVDVKVGRVVGRVELPFRPASLAVAGGRGQEVVWVGGMGGEVAALRDGTLTPVLNPRGRGPARVVALGGRRAAVASTWEEVVRVVDADGGGVTKTIPVPFPPGAMLARTPDRLVVAEAFGGRVADVDLKAGRVRVRTLDGVNLRALALSGDGKELLVGHMAAPSGPVPVTEANIDGGRVLSSRLSAVRLSEFEDPARDGAPLPRRWVALDGSRHGAADPSALAVGVDGAVVLIALAGAHELIKNDRRLGPPDDAKDLLPLGHHLRLETVAVGRGPVDLALDPSGETAVTADAMSDTVTVVRVADLVVVGTIRLGPRSPRRSAAQRGEAAFLDGRRALDRWISCASCHPAGHTNALNFDTLGDGGYGAPKNTPSLLGVGPTAPFAWTGRFPGLEAQVAQSLQTSLHGPPFDDRTTTDLSAYLRSLAPPPPRRAPDDPAALRGAAVFETRRCRSCHRPPYYTADGLKDVGLDDGPGGHRAFNPPSLRGVGWSAPYFHDGRAPTLDDVLATHPPIPRTPLRPDEREDLKAFLESL